MNDVTNSEEANGEAATPVTKDIQNGVTRPKSGTKTGRVWEIADSLSAEAGAPVVRKSVLDQAIAEGINASTTATQYGRWRKYHGLAAESRAAAPAAEDTTVEGE